MFSRARGDSVADRGQAQVVEIDAAGLVWIKSSASNGVGGNCVEVAVVRRHVSVRCSRHRLGPVLTCSISAWAALVDCLRATS